MRSSGRLLRRKFERCVRALEDARGRLRLLSAHTCGIIFELDSELRFVRVWTSDPQLLACPQSELLGRTVVEVLGPKLGQRHHEAARTTVETGASVGYAYDLDVPGGHRHFACESVAVPSCSGNDRHAVFWIRDITDQVQLRKKLMRAERLASVGALAAGVAHEINNPLGYMMLNTEQLRRTFHQLTPEMPLDDRLASLTSSVNMIHDGIGHVKRIVNELLLLTKPDDPIEPVDIRQAVDLSLELTRAICERRAKVHIEWRELPRVPAHQGRLVQVFTNLLINAAEAIEEGRPEENNIVVSASIVGPSTVQVAVRDTGTGISEENLPHVFDPFFTTKQQGTGLGLAICQSIINSFNGEIRCESAPHKGSVFRVLIPAV